MQSGLGAAIRLQEAGLVPALLGASLAVQYLCVPETDHFFNLGILAAGLVVIEAFTRTAYFASRMVLLALTVWAGWHGASGRDSAMIGAAVSFWPLVVVVVCSGSQQPIGVSRAEALVVAAMCVGSSAAVARTGALASTAQPALFAACVWLPGSLILGTVAVWAQRRHRAAQR